MNKPGGCVMDHLVQRQMRTSMWVFIVAWALLVAVVFSFIFGPWSGRPMSTPDTFGLSLIALSWLFPAAALGRFLGPRLSRKGFGKTLGVQILGSAAWSMIATLLLFLILFHGDIKDWITGARQAKQLGTSFITGFPGFFAFFFAVFSIITMFASAVSMALLARQAEAK